VDKDLKGDIQISREHIENNKAVRAMLRDRGVIPENLPIAEDVKKVQRRLEGEEKKVLKEVKKIQGKKKK
jgi:DNA-damage-inducible protein D